MLVVILYIILYTVESESVSQSVFGSMLYVDNRLEWFSFYKIPGAQRSQVHFASSTSLIVQSGTLFRED